MGNVGDDGSDCRGLKIGEPVLLFEKIEDDVIQRQLDKLAATKEANAAAEAAQQVEPQKDAISFDDFQKMDIRVFDDSCGRKGGENEETVEIDGRYGYRSA